MSTKFELVRTVSQSFFEKNSHATITCPGCQSALQVVVSTLTITKCKRCGATITVEFKER